MARYPVDKDGKLIAVVIGGPLPAGAQGEADRPPADGNQYWDGSAWAWPIAVVRERALDAVSRRFEAALNGGLAYGGKVLQIREQDQVNITAMGSEARWAKLVGTGWPANFGWRMADDTMLPLSTPDTMIALGEAAKAEIYRLRKVKWAHVDAVMALQSAAAIEAYDIETGW